MYYAIRASRNIQADIERGFVAYDKPDVFRYPETVFDSKRKKGAYWIDFSILCNMAWRIRTEGMDAQVDLIWNQTADSLESDISDSQLETIKQMAEDVVRAHFGYSAFNNMAGKKHGNTFAYHDGLDGWVVTHGWGLSCVLLGEYETDDAAIADAQNAELCFCSDDGSGIGYGLGHKTRGTVEAVARLEDDPGNGLQRWLIKFDGEPFPENLDFKAI